MKADSGDGNRGGRTSAVEELRRENIRLREELERSRRAENALQETELRLRKVFQHAPLVVWAIDKDGVFTLSEGRGLSALGLKPGQVVGQSALVLYADNETLMAVFRRCLNGEEFTETVAVGELYYETLYTPLLDDDDVVVGATGVSTDVTERVQATRRIRESEKRFRSLVETTSDWVWEIDENDVYTYASPKVRDLLGYEPEEVLGKTPFDFMPPAEAKRAAEVLHKITADRKPITHLQNINLHRDGHEVILETNGVPLFDEEGHLLGYRGIDRDVTARRNAERATKRLETQLFHSQKMETVGTLAGGIAHDFNNILAPILGYTDMALDTLAPDDPLREDLEQVLKAARRARDLVHQILVFSSRMENERKPVQFHLITREALKLMRSTLPTTIGISQSIDVHSGTVLADSSQLHQILLNLCTNAAYAMQGRGGTLRVEMVPWEVDEKFAREHANLDAGKHVRLTVSDTGSGMDELTRARIFEPFFTTKKAGEGTGLGLSVVHGIVLSHEGEIVVESAPGKGSTFHVYFPIYSGEADRNNDGEEFAPARGGEHVLLIDDEEDIARMGKRLLGQLGYRVTAETDSKAALELFRSQPADFDVVVTDYTMPHLTGIDLAKELLQIRSDIPIVLTTGFSDTVSPEAVEEVGIAGLVMKPVVGRTLTQKIRQVLDRRLLGGR